MARSFASGLVWGFVVVGAGLALISQLAPPPRGALPAAGTPAATSAPAANDDTAPVASADQTKAERAGSQTSAATADAAKAASDTAKSGAGSASSDQAATQPAETGTGVAATPTPPASAQESAAPGAEGAPAPGATAADQSSQDSGVAQSGQSPQAGSTGTAGQGQEATAPKDGQQVAEAGAAEAVKPAEGDKTAPDAGTGAKDGQAATAPAPAEAASTTGAPTPEAPSGTADQATVATAKTKPAAETGPTAPDALATLADKPDLAAQPEPPKDDAGAPSLSSLNAALTAPAPDAAPAPVATPAPEPTGPKDALLVPNEGAGLDEPTRLPQIAAAEDPGLAPAPLPSVTEPAPGDAQPPAPEPLAPRVITPDTPEMPGAKPIQSTLPTVLKPSVPGVETNALPQIGDPPKAETATAEGAADASAEKPIVKYARKFDGAGGKPLFSILLHDVGGAGMKREDLANLPFPVTFVVDPLASDAKEAAKIYRDAGQEVLMLANGIPPGATAGDVAQSFQTLQDILPESVGVIDMATAGFQDNRPLATLVVPEIADEGRGLVTYDRGLNAADQIARRDGLPSAVIFRRLDGENESQPTIRRYLDRAAFKAAQEGSVVVIGDTRADTVATILQWTIEGKASTVALAPITAVMAQKR